MADIRSAQFHDADPGLFSLSQIMHLMRIEFGRAQRYGYPLSVLVIAVDRLGHLRDLYGYESKEAVLDEVGRLLQTETRTCDFLGRLADDRLLAVVPHTPGEGTRVLAERLLKGVRAIGFESEAKKIAITISIGTATMDDAKTLFFDQLVAAAEAALEEASAAGGDRWTRRDPAKVGG
jgi:two-component system, cell cycle response regulator